MTKLRLVHSSPQKPEQPVSDRQKAISEIQLKLEHLQELHHKLKDMLKQLDRLIESPPKPRRRR